MNTMSIGCAQSGVRLSASCSPFTVVPPELWQMFKTAVMAQAKAMGLSVHFGEDDGTIQMAIGRYWEMQRAHVQAGQTGG